jgi:hypothetical protein
VELASATITFLPERAGAADEGAVDAAGAGSFLPLAKTAVVSTAVMVNTAKSFFICDLLVVWNWFVSGKFY